MGNQQEAMQKGFSSSLTIESLDDVARAAAMIYKSRALGNHNNAEEVGAKIMTGLELGLSPMTAVRNIYFFDGSATISGPLLAALIRDHPDYDYKILGSNQKGAKVRFFRRETVDGETKMVAQQPDVQFTREMAERAGLLSKQNWKHYFEDMAVWRCIARGKRWHCPDVGMGTLYIRDEVENGTVKEVEPTEVQTESTPEHSGPSEPTENGKPTGALPQDAKTEETPDFTEKGESSETKPKAPEGEAKAPNPQVKPLDPEPNAKESPEEKSKPDTTPKSEPGTEKAPKKFSGGSGGGATNEGPKPPQKPQSEVTAPANVPDESGEAPKEANRQTKQSRRSRLPSYLIEGDAVNVDAMTEGAVQKAEQFEQALSGTESGNALLKTIQRFRSDVREEYPNENDVDRVALDEILDHHIDRIGHGPDEQPEEAPEENTAEEEGEDEADGLAVPEIPEDSADPVADVNIAGMPWFDTVGRRFREDMEKTRAVLLEEVAKQGITPLKTRLDEFRERLEKAGPTSQMKDEYEKAVKPFQTVLSMREALMEGETAEIEVFNRAINDFLETAETLTNPKRKARAERIVFREAKRLEDEFASLNLEFHEEGEDPNSEEAVGKETGEEEKEDPVPDIPLPPGMPKRGKLRDADISRTGEVAKRIRNGTLDSIKGVGPASVEKVADFLREIAEVGEQEDLGF